jgi:hypothetical protein
MFFNTKFDGKIFQVIEALDCGDAVSNQVIELHAMLKSQGFTSVIHAKFFHENMRSFCSDLDQLDVTDQDVVIAHFSLYSEYAIPYVQRLRCTKIIDYHNITPHTFFSPGTRIHEFCKKGREQLRAIIADFHYFWGDSAYNVQELVDAGAEEKNCAVVPIIVGRSLDNDKNNGSGNTPILRAPETGSWMFLGRIASNKGQLRLVRLFAKIRAAYPEIARKLYLVGGYETSEPYALELLAEIARSQLGGDIVLTGKVSDAEVNAYLDRAAVYVSMSEHEGFGVPLIEAALRGLPVLALRNTAVGETMGEGAGLVDNVHQLEAALLHMLSDAGHYHAIRLAQKRNAGRFTRDGVAVKLHYALGLALPRLAQFTTVSIVICTYNRDTLLARCLDYLQYQTNQNFEVVVINGPSNDKTEEILAQYKHRIKIGHNAQRNLSVSRNLGIELSDGDLIAFIDDDAIPFDDWVETLLREFNRRPLSVAGLGGPAYYAGSLEFQAQDNGVNKFAQAWVNIESKAIGTDGWMRYPTGTNCCFRADVLRLENGFDEQFDYYLDESELCFRLQQNNRLIGYCPDLYLRHEFAQSHNRQGKLNYNWFTICKNTAYYIAAYSGLRGGALSEYLSERMHSERIAPIEAARNAGEISSVECERHVAAICAGFDQGVADARDFPKTRALKDGPELFKVFTHGGARGAGAAGSQRKLHICILSKEFPPFVRGGGIGTLYYHLASELLLMGHYVTVVAPSGATSIYRRGRFSIRYTKPEPISSDALGANGFANNVNWSLSALHAIAVLHQERPIDVIDSALWDSETLALALLPKEARPPLVIRLVTPFPVATKINGWQISAREAELYTSAERTLISEADAIVPISESIAATIESEHDMRRDRRWRLSHCGIAYWPFFDVNQGYADLGDLRGKSLQAAQGGKMVLFVGRLEMRKGIDILLAAANDFLAADADTYLVIAGRDVEGWEEKSKAVCDPALLDRIVFMGEVDDVVREKLFHAAYCLVFPSRYESFGLVPLEAFVHGLPVVASRSGAIPEVVSDEQCGLLFAAESSVSLAHSVKRLMEDVAFRNKLAIGAKKQIRKFSSRQSAIRTIQIYLEICSPT